MTPTPKDPAAATRLKAATFRLTGEILDRLEREAKTRHVSQSALVRGVLAEFLKAAR